MSNGKMAVDVVAVKVKAPGKLGEDTKQRITPSQILKVEQPLLPSGGSRGVVATPAAPVPVDELLKRVKRDTLEEMVAEQVRTGQVKRSDIVKQLPERKEVAAAPAEATPTEEEVVNVNPLEHALGWKRAVSEERSTSAMWSNVLSMIRLETDQRKADKAAEQMKWREEQMRLAEDRSRIQYMVAKAQEAAEEAPVDKLPPGPRSYEKGVLAALPTGLLSRLTQTKKEAGALRRAHIKEMMEMQNEEALKDPLIKMLRQVAEENESSGDRAALTTNNM